MIATLTNEKNQKLKTFVLNVLTINKSIIRHLAKIIVLLFYCYLENDKVTSLRLNKGNFDAPTKISPERKQALK